MVRIEKLSDLRSPLAWATSRRGVSYDALNGKGFACVPIRERERVSVGNGKAVESRFICMDD